MSRTCSPTHPQTATESYVPRPERRRSPPHKGRAVTASPYLPRRLVVLPAAARPETPAQ